MILLRWLTILAMSLICSGDTIAQTIAPVPGKTVVLTFDDSVKSHATFVAPLLKELGFGASFFVTHRWMDDTINFMSWEDVAALHEMGFEIGNHAWTHADFSQPVNGLRLASELALVEYMLAKYNVPKPVSFAWCGNGFSPEARTILDARGYGFARRGMQPEIEYGLREPGPLYDPLFHDPLLIPTAGDAYPNWNLDHFKAVVDRAQDGKIVVLQFHGVPDTAHPWVHTPPEMFKQYMQYLKDEGFRVIALRDIAEHIPANAGLTDPARTRSNPGRPDENRVWPQEVIASRADASYWLAIMNLHRFSENEIEGVFQLPRGAWPEPETPPRGAIFPYPGGRHPRLGFFEGMIDPMRGTKVSIFSPWGDGGYIVLDVPEAIFCQDGLLFLGHTHIPTLWDEQNIVIENRDWERGDSNRLQSNWKLPNGVRLGAIVHGEANGASVELWLENGSGTRLTGLRTQVCVMLGRLPGFEAQHQRNKTYTQTTATAQNYSGTRQVHVEFERAGRVWGNAECPCIHSDPIFPDTAPGERTSLTGRIWFDEK